MLRCLEECQQPELALKGTAGASKDAGILGMLFSTDIAPSRLCGQI